MFLVTNREEMNWRDWHYLDFLLISGDAYVDHPSFGAAIVGRWLEHLGYRVGIIAQPDWHDPASVAIMGKPRLAVLIGAGNMDSMINHYTAMKKPRRQDAYSPGGKTGFRPDNATIVYTKLVREAFGKSIPIIIGGVEASLRRFAHYDFWQDKVRPSILVETEADLLVYGMAEKALKEVAEKLDGGEGVLGCRRIQGLCWLTDKPPAKKSLELPSLQQVTKSKQAFAKAYILSEREQNFYDGKILVQRHDDIYMVQNPPAYPLTTKEMDTVYELPYEGNWHPAYDKAGGVPALSEVRFSLISHRGCFGGCSFCSLNFHQGRVIQNRSDASLIREAKKLAAHPEFKGYIHDVGGPTANFRGQGCEKAKKKGPCHLQQCLYPKPCKNLKPNQLDNVVLLQKLRRIEGVKKVFIRSGLRYDYLLLDKRPDYFRELCEHHISGQLKVAPEHTEEHVLNAMGKPNFEVYKRFSEKYKNMNKMLDKKQYLVPYFIAAHPGSRITDAAVMAEKFAMSRLQPEQVQLFIPTPGTRSTCMYYTGLDPETMQPIYVARNPKERQLQRALLQFMDPKNHALVIKGLEMAGREDLIGYGRNYLVQPPRGKEAEYKKKAEAVLKAKNKIAEKISKDKYGNEIKQVPKKFKETKQNKPKLKVEKLQALAKVKNKQPKTQQKKRDEAYDNRSRHGYSGNKKNRGAK